METDKLLKDFKLTSLGLAPDELNKPLVVVLYEQGCEEYLTDVKFGAMSSEAAAICVCVPCLNGFNGSKAAKEMLLPSRESIADLTETLLKLHRADAAAIVASTDICLAGMVMGAMRKNVPLAVAPIVRVDSKSKDSLLVKSLAECGKIGQSAAEEQLSALSDRIDDFFSLSLFLEGAGLAPCGAAGANKKILARLTGELAAQRAAQLSYPKKEFSQSCLQAGLAVHISAMGTCSSMLHIIAIARENGLDTDFEHICSVASKIPLAETNGSASKIIKKGATTLLRDLVAKKAVSEAFEGYLNQTMQAAKPNGESFSFKGEATLNRVKGNVAEDGLARFDPLQKPFKGPVFAFESEELALAAIFGGTDFSNSAIVITSQGAKDNGMPPLDIESALLAVEAKNTIIVTDGRLIEFGSYPIVSMLDKTENFDLIRTGDVLEVDFKKGKINLNLGAKELSSRLKKFVPSTSKTNTLMRYANSVSDCSKGCVLKR